MTLLNPRDLERYSRQLPLFGEGGQECLKKAQIFIAGAGGLGSPVSLYLAVAGLGSLTIADMDAVDLSNLNRQILHSNKDIGKRKTVSATETLEAFNPDLTIHAVDTRINEDNVSGLVGNADGIVDATDNFRTRYILNRVAIEKGIPFFHGAVRGFHGQVSTIVPGEGPCLACIFPRAPPEERTPVIGATAGVIGAIQATEVIKYLTKSGHILCGRLLVWDGLAAIAEEIAIERSPACAICNEIRSGNGVEKEDRR